MEFLQSLADSLYALEPALIGSLAIVVEFGLRFVKSSKPLSLLYLVAEALQLLGLIFMKAGELLDNVLPQRRK